MIPRRKNPQAPWLWEYLTADGRWTDLSTAEHSYREITEKDDA